MDTWRCPTCLAVLVESNAKRCPSCHSRLRKRRSQPIVLGESSRLDMQAALAVDKRNKKRGERTFTSNVAPSAPPVPPRIDVPEPEPELVAIVVDSHEPEVVVEETFAAAPLVAAPIENTFEPEPVEAVLEEAPEAAPEVELEPVAVADAIAAFTLPSAPEREVFEPAPAVDLVAAELETEPEPEILPDPEPVAVADAIAAFTLPERTTEPAADVAEPKVDLVAAEPIVAVEEPAVDLGVALDGDVNSIVDALHRKARGEADEPAPVESAQAPVFEEPVEDRPPRPLRLMSSSAGNRRRWSRRED